MGNCPSCGEWNTFNERIRKKETKGGHKASVDGLEKKQKPVKLNEVESKSELRKKTGISELDRVLGGGILAGAYILLGGDPGVGKSTLTLQVAKSNPELNILYCAGEESAAQIRQRADRLGVKSDNLSVYSETLIDSVIEEVRQNPPDLLIVDSIQTMYRTELSSMPGSIQQVKECAALLQQVAKKLELPVILIGHVTKEGDIAGPRVLEHMVDTVLQFEGDKHYTYRLLRSVKNRFGPAQEVGVFEMTERGLEEVANPSAFFVQHYDEGVSGNAVTCTLEGSRPMLIEVQALVSPSSYSTAQRTSGGFDRNRLMLILAVLEKRCGYHFSSQDVFLNIAGGFRINDPAADLAVACALVSSLTDQPVIAQSCMIGEIGLGGEIRSVPLLERRIQEAKKMGLDKVMTASATGTAAYLKSTIKKALGF